MIELTFRTLSLLIRGAKYLTVGIRNKKDSDLHYKMQFTPISSPTGGIFQVGNWFQFGENTEYKVPPADANVRQIRLSIPTSIPSGSYFMTFDVIDTDLPTPDNVYDQRLLLW